MSAPDAVSVPAQQIGSPTPAAERAPRRRPPRRGAGAAPAGEADRQVAEQLRAGLGPLVTGLHEVATTAGLAEVVELLVQECSRPSGSAARVVVGGATKRGKSALVNALIGRPGLLPVDADVATGVHVAVTWGEAERAVVHRADAEPLEVPPDDLVRYASERHNPNNHLGVTAVEVTTPAALLRGGLELVDTPGVDSVIARHADVTLAALAQADALLLVVDPSRPLIAPELAFLAEATSRISQVAFVLTKTDLHREWRRVLDDDRALVATHAARFARAPFLAVSSKLAGAAATARRAGRTELAERVEQESGLAALVTELSRVAAGVERVRLGNVVQLALVVVARLDTAVRAAVPASDDPAAAAAVEADRDRLRTLSESGSRWRQSLAHGVRRLQMDLDAHLAEALSRADREFAESLVGGKWTLERGEGVPRELDDAVRVLWLDAAAMVGARLDRLVEDLIETLAGYGAEFTAPELVRPRLQRADTRTAMVDDDPSATGLTGMLSSYGAVAGLAMGAGRMLFMVSPLLGIAGAGLGAAIGIAGVVLRRKTTAKVRDRQAAQRLASKALAEGRADIARELSRHLVDVQFDLENTATDLITARRRELDDAVAQGKELLRQDQAERDRRRKEAADLLRRLNSLREQAATLHHVAESARAVPVAG